MKVQQLHFLVAANFLLLVLGSAIYSQIILQESEPSPLWYNWQERFFSADPQRKGQFYRSICDQLGATENEKIPSKEKSIVRIATYDVHFWQNPFAGWADTKNDAAFSIIVRTIDAINADVLVLQEVGNAQYNRPEFDQLLQKRGYDYVERCDGGSVYNYIASKYPLSDVFKKEFQVNPSDKQLGQRCFVRAVVNLPNNNKISVYGTHLALRDIQDGAGMKIDAEEVRLEQFKELVAYKNQHDQNNNVIIGVNSNAIRKKDLSYRIGNDLVWDFYQAMKQKSGESVSTKALEYMDLQGYRDCFDVTNIVAPKFTSLYGTRIDFLLLGLAWNLPISGCYAFYSAASDHIPVIMDIDVSEYFAPIIAPAGKALDALAQAFSKIR